MIKKNCDPFKGLDPSLVTPTSNPVEQQSCIRDSKDLIFKTDQFTKQSRELIMAAKPTSYFL